jgi:hypothetical protein
VLLAIAAGITQEGRFVFKTMELTKDLLEAGRTPNGGYNLAQLKILGVKLPGGGRWPAHGWLHNLIGQDVPIATYEAFVAMGRASKIERREAMAPERASAKLQRLERRNAEKNANQEFLL